VRWLWLLAVLAVAACGQAGSARAEGDGWKAELRWSPPRPRALQEARLVLRVWDREGRPADVRELEAVADMPEMSHEPDRLRFRPVGQGTYEAAHKFSMDGGWRVRVTGRVGDAELEAEFPLSVGGP